MYAKGDQATTRILAASLGASLLATAVLLPRNRHYRRQTTSPQPARGSVRDSEESSHSAAWLSAAEQGAGNTSDSGGRS